MADEKRPGHGASGRDRCARGSATISLAPARSRFFMPRGEHRMAVGRIGADDQHDIGGSTVLKSCVPAEVPNVAAQAIAGGRMADAGAGVDIVVVGGDVGLALPAPRGPILDDHHLAAKPGQVDSLAGVGSCPTGRASCRPSRGGWTARRFLCRAGESAKSARSADTISSPRSPARRTPGDAQLQHRLGGVGVRVIGDELLQVLRPLGLHFAQVGLRGRIAWA